MAHQRQICHTLSLSHTHTQWNQTWYAAKWRWGVQGDDWDGRRGKIYFTKFPHLCKAPLGVPGPRPGGLSKAHVILQNVALQRHRSKGKKISRRRRASTSPLDNHERHLRSSLFLLSLIDFLSFPEPGGKARVWHLRHRSKFQGGGEQTATSRQDQDSGCLNFHTWAFLWHLLFTKTL